MVIIIYNTGHTLSFIQLHGSQDQPSAQEFTFKESLNANLFGVEIFSLSTIFATCSLSSSLTSEK